MTINPEITVGNLITSISVLISILTIYLAWLKDRKLKIRTNADLIRSAAANTLRGIERWKEISLSLFYKCDSDFVETSEMVKEKENIKYAELEKVRDFLWKRLMSIVADNKNQILKEDLKNAYYNLFPFAPDIRFCYEETLSRMQQAENVMIADFIENHTQNAILNINDNIDNIYCSAILGNQLRSVRNDCVRRYKLSLDNSYKDIREILINIIRETDKKLTRYNIVYE